MTKRKSLVKNFSYLSFVQILNLLFPILIYPYLVEILGFELYGKVIYATAILAYFLVLVEYGFNLSATKVVAEKRDNPTFLRKFVAGVIWSKVLLSITSYFLLIIGVIFIPFFSENLWLIFFSSFVLLSNIVTPLWYFQGNENLFFSTLFTFFSRLLSIVLIFILVKDQSDYLWVPVINGGMSIIAGIGMTIQMIKEIGGLSLRFSFNEVKANLQDGLPFFYSRFFITLRERVATIAIGAWMGYEYVTYLDLIQKITTLLVTPINILNTVIYPRVAATKNLKIAYRGMGIAFGYSIIIYLILVFFPYHLVTIYSIDNLVLPIQPYFSIYGLVIPLQAFVYFMGNTVLVVYGFKKEFNSSVIIGGLTYLALITLGFVFPMELKEVGICLVFSYAIIVVLRHYHIKRNNLYNLKSLN